MLPDENASMRSECQPKNMRSCENHGPAFRAGRKTLHNGVGETHPLSEFLAGVCFWLLSRRAENTSIDSIIFKCASDVAPQSKDRTAATEACPAALYQRPS